MSFLRQPINVVSALSAQLRPSWLGSGDDIVTERYLLTTTE